MGQSVLTPLENHPGKVGEPLCAQAWSGVTHSASGEREFGSRFRNRLVGNVLVCFTAAGREALKQMTTVGRQGSVACGELSFLFDVAGALNIISGGERRLNT